VYNVLVLQILLTADRTRCLLIVTRTGFSLLIVFYLEFFLVNFMSWLFRAVGPLALQRMFGVFSDN